MKNEIKNPKLNKTVLVVTYVLASIACLNAKALNVFGSDDRVPVRLSYPYSAIGRVESNGGHCTGTLIGPDLVLTAAHCIGRKGDPVEFYPKMIDGESLTKANGVRTWRGTYDPQLDREKDWAVVQLDKNLGSIYGYIPVLNDPDATYVTQVGYSYDRYDGEGWRQRGAKVLGQDKSNKTPSP